MSGIEALAVLIAFWDENQAPIYQSDGKSNPRLSIYEML
jgi:hypothetical protein